MSQHILPLIKAHLPSFIRLPHLKRRKEAEIAFGKVFEVMDALRGPDGCAWDREQNIASLRSHLLEEAHETTWAMDALGNEGQGSPEALKQHQKELGDVLFQVLFQAQIQMEAERFSVADVCDAMREKLVFRHPHVFGSEQERNSPPPDWEEMKAKERALEAAGFSKNELAETKSAQTKSMGEALALAGIPKNLPTLIRAMRMGEKAHQVGFDWPDHRGVLAKMREELDEIEEAFLPDTALSAAENEAQIQARVADEVGDLLYAAVNLCRHVKVDPEACLAGTVRKFETRFGYVEQALATEGRKPEQASLDEMEALWQEAKKKSFA